MTKQSLFAACKRLFRDQLSGTYEVGNNNIFLELYTQKDITNGTTIGDSSEENIVVVADDTITIPEGYTLTPVQPKKSLVIICNTLVNNGTISMYQKAPNVLPHDLFIIDKNDFGGKSDIIIPAYANNQVTYNNSYAASDKMISSNGNSGTNRNCGSGGIGSGWYRGTVNVTSGSGYAFGGGAGTSGWGGDYDGYTGKGVDQTYPMRGANTASNIRTYLTILGGVGNPTGTGTAVQNFGCGGRVIIFCSKFTNNGIINVNGTATREAPDNNRNIYAYGCGGASGAGAIDIFYTNLITQGTMTASGGENFTHASSGSRYQTPGKGGDGSITLTTWNKSQIVKPVEKYMSRSNMIYFLTNYVKRLKQED